MIESEEIIEQGEGNANVPFNSALNLLERLSGILRAITLIYCDEDVSLGKRQHLKLTLTKQFFIQAVPLLDKTFIEEIREEILTREPKWKRILNQKGVLLKLEERYDNSLEQFLDNTLIQLQLKLQEKGAFMPSKSETSMF